MKKIWIFSGTSEGRKLASCMQQAGYDCLVSVATKYGQELSHTVKSMQGRLTASDMIEIMKEYHFDAVIDATHPFAQKVSKEIKTACDVMHLPYYRLARNTQSSFTNCIYVSSFEEAAEKIQQIPGTILLMTGTNHIEDLMDDPNRFYVRTLPSIESIQFCLQAGIPASHILALQGPFSKAFNIETVRHCQADCLVTKESGQAGGFEQKIEAAKACHIPAIVIKNPEKIEDGYSYAEILSLFHIQESLRSIVFAGTGPANDALWTQEVEDAIRSADILFGAKRIIDPMDVHCPKIPYYEGDKILAFLNVHPEYQNPVVVFSGDVSVYSGAMSMRKLFKNWQVEVLSGISSVVYMAAKMGISLHDTHIISCHGRTCNVMGNIRKYKKVFILVSGKEDIQRFGKEWKGMPLKIVMGYELSSKQECIQEIQPEKMVHVNKDGLYLLYVENQDPSQWLSDDDFIRTKVPMTKDEIRRLSLSYLDLKEDSVLVDIGAGTGSISIQAALLYPNISIYAIEKETNAIELMKKNIQKFHLDTISCIHAKAPEGLKDLPFITHAFIGGSSHQIQLIIETLLKKNPSIRMVINCITLETLQQVQKAFQELPIGHIHVREISVQHMEKLGSYHRMKAQNPVWIIDCEGIPWQND